MDTLVSPTAVTPGIVSDSKGDGPYWSAASPAEVGLAVQNNTLGVGHIASDFTGFNAVRSQSQCDTQYLNNQRQSDAQFRELMQEHRFARQAYFGPQAVDGNVKDVIEAALNAREVGSLRQQLSDEKTASILSKILDAVSALKPVK